MSTCSASAKPSSGTDSASRFGLGVGMNASVRSHRGRLLDVRNRGVRAMSLLGHGHGLLDAAGDFEAEMAWNRRLAWRGDDHAADVDEALERVDREDRVHGMKAESRAVRLDVVGPARVVVGEATHDLVRISRRPENALPHLGI